ncbi:MAG: hypothetical protein AABM31_12780 [Actinomycetota bacterium]
MHGLGLKRALRTAVLTAVALALLPAASASAGRLIVTGHDADLHCTLGSQCHFVEAAVNYVRAGAPDPSKPVLVLDRDDLDMVRALDAAFGPGVVPREVVEPRSAPFRTLPLTTARYSAILIASDTTCGGCDLNEFDSTPDSDAINARKAEIASFFNSGGGVYANSGASHGDGLPGSGSDNYYSFLPIQVGGQTVTGPFCLTAVGASIGLEDPAGCPDASRHRGTRDDINCCATHNSFGRPPAGSALRVAETDVGIDGAVGPDDVPQTLVADGIASGGAILDPPVLGRAVNVARVRGKVFFARPARGRRGTAQASQKGLRFVPLRAARQIPTGSFLDTRKGTVRLQSARDLRGTRQQGDFGSGLFQVLQSRKRAAKGLTELRLKGSSFAGCKTPRRGRRATTSASRRIRRLSSNTRGRFRTRGRHSAATVRGTKWTMTDRCDGTLTQVTRGAVTVRDFRRRKTIVVKAGKSYLAKARR